MTDSFRIQFHEDGNVEVTTDEAKKNGDVFPLVVTILVLLYFLLKKSQSSIKDKDGRVHLSYEFILSSLSVLLDELLLGEEDTVTISHAFFITSKFLNTNEQSIDTIQLADLSYDFSITHSLMDVGECDVQSSDTAISSLSFLTRLGELADDDPLPPPDDAVWIVIPY